MQQRIARTLTVYQFQYQRKWLRKCSLPARWPWVLLAVVRVRVRMRLDLSAALAAVAPVERWPDALAQPLCILLELVQQLVLLAGVDGALVGLVVDVCFIR